METLKTQTRYLGRIEATTNRMGRRGEVELAKPIREWFKDHPEEIARENYFSASFRQQPDGSYRCFLEIMGKHHWTARETGRSLTHALKRSLESALPDVSLSEWDNRE